MQVKYLGKNTSKKVQGISTSLYLELNPVLQRHKGEKINYYTLKEWERECAEVVKKYNDTLAKKGTPLSFVFLLCQEGDSISGKVDIICHDHKLSYFQGKKMYGYYGS
jgi:hypothetical protein